MEKVKKNTKVKTKFLALGINFVSLHYGKKNKRPWFWLQINT